MKPIPTAEELAVQIEDTASYEQLANPIIFASLVAIEFAKIHVKAALEAAAENAEVELVQTLSAYPLSKIL